MVEEGDADMTGTALRETFEEVGIQRDAVQPLGILDDIATPQGFVITPVVGFLSSPPEVNVNKEEVAEVFEVPLSFFDAPGSGRQEFREVKGRRYEIWHYDTGQHVIWGATAKIVRLLIDRTGPIRRVV
jgi:8-oxo-dGTP pyrophosphatase MutT (NUDIX family)